jgi:hypothetical protein
MLKKLLPSVLVAFLPCYSYSDSIAPYYGNTNNASSSGLTWGMTGILPDVPGLDIQNVIYSYKIQKETNDAVDVHVQNKNANGTGYVFRETDSWLPGSLTGTQINKVVPVIPNIPQSAWGQGSIDVEGNGSVTDPSVIYTYKVTPCYDPQFDPNCPGYVTPIPVIVEVNLDDIYDVTEDENVNLDNKEEIARIKAEEEELLEKKEEEEEEAERKLRTAKALDAIDQTDIILQSEIIMAMNRTADIIATNAGYYSINIPGKEYKDTVTLLDTKLPESKSGLRNGLAQQLLHNQMVASQYE